MVLQGGHSTYCGLDWAMSTERSDAKTSDLSLSLSSGAQPHPRALANPRRLVQDWSQLPALTNPECLILFLEIILPRKPVSGVQGPFSTLPLGVTWLETSFAK